jgi:type VI secretion system protein ImpE
MATDVLAQAKELYVSGNLQAAIAALIAGVKASPDDVALRTFLFELSCFAGEWERADRQLDVIGHQSASAEIGVQVYRNCIKAETARQHLIRDGLQPHFLSEPPAYIDRQLDALNLLRVGDNEGAAQAFLEVEEARPALSGTLNGQKFEDFRDLDDLCAPVLELIVQEKYTWLPLEQVKEIQIDPPTQLRDLLWSGASIQTDQRELRAFIPNLYVGTAEDTDDQRRLGRMTDWREVALGVYHGVGLRLFSTGNDELSILKIKHIEFNLAGSGSQVTGEDVTGAEGAIE